MIPLGIMDNVHKGLTRRFGCQMWLEMMNGLLKHLAKMRLRLSEVVADSDLDTDLEVQEVAKNKCCLEWGMNKGDPY